MDSHTIGWIEIWLGLDWYRIGNGLTLDWLWIDIRLAQDWQWIGRGLKMDWHLLVDGLVGLSWRMSESSSVETLR